MHYSTRHGPSRQRNVLANPVAKAIAVRQIQQHLRTVQTLAYVLADGEPAADQLAHMARIIGLGAEVAFHIGHAQGRALHGALRTVHAMAMAGYTWRTDMAGPVDRALGEASQLITQHSNVAWTMLAGAEWIAHRISTRTTAPGDVAGAELYQLAPAMPHRGAGPARARGEGARQTAGVDESQRAPAGPVSEEEAPRSAGRQEVMDEAPAPPGPVLPCPAPSRSHDARSVPRD